MDSTHYAHALLLTLEKERDAYPEPLYSMLRCIIVNQINLSTQLSTQKDQFAYDSGAD